MEASRRDVDVNEAPARGRAGYRSDLPVFRRRTVRLELGGCDVHLDGEGVHWFAADRRVTALWERLDGRTGDRLAAEVAAREGWELPRARWWVDTALAELVEKGLAAHEPPRPEASVRRSRALELEALRELWVHTNNSCNLRCRHCLVGSGPGGAPGLPTDALLDLFWEAHALGVRRFYFTGGEPFVRPDISELVRFVTEELDAELIVITNGTMFRGRRWERFRGFRADRLRLQVSLDGTTPAANDALRGEGTFAVVEEAVRRLAAAGFEVALTAVAGRSNLGELHRLPELAAAWGARSVHLMWPHRKGRVLETMPGFFPSAPELAELADRVLEECERHGVDFDNYGSVLFRVNGQPGVRWDLSNAGWDSLFVDHDGGIYPSPVFSQEPGWRAGSLEDGLERTWRTSPVLERVRELSQLDLAGLEEDPLRWFLGGGDLEHIAHAAGAAGPEEVRGASDPYYPVLRHLALRALERLARAGREAWNPEYEGPGIYHVMGDGAIACGTEGVRDADAAPVQTLHSSCVLSFDVDRPRALVRRFYGAAAEEPREDLCCPVRYAPEDADHIPAEVLERFYGCGSPIADAGVAEGETVVDLGCGAGIDCFIAARKVGPAGRVIGVDMTEEMLAVARENAPRVAERLGYDVVEFRRGFLESLPVADGSADLVTSNCVINLSPDKRQVFREIYRVLRDLGRVVISDIVCEADVPPELRVREHLWGECISGALSEGELLRQLVKAGFYGVTLLKRSFWREVEGHRFHSVTVVAYRWARGRAAAVDGGIAVYRGPFAEVVDDRGRSFRRGVPVPVDRATAERLRTHPYDRVFQVLRPGELPADVALCCDPVSGEVC